MGRNMDSIITSGQLIEGMTKKELPIHIDGNSFYKCLAITFLHFSNVI